MKLLFTKPARPPGLGLARVLALLSALLAGGCALSPQAVLLHPFIDAPAEPVGRDRVLRLNVVDRRPTPAFGRRGGVYETAELTPRNDVAGAVYAALAERLQASRFRVVDAAPGTQFAPQTSPALTLTVTIRRIDYSVRPDPLVGGALLNEIRTRAVLDAELQGSDGGRRAGRYQANAIQRRLGYPSEADNEETINEVIAQALQQLLLDADIRALLAR